MKHEYRELNLIQNVDDDIRQLTEGITECRRLDAAVSEMDATPNKSERKKEELNTLRKKYVEFKDKFEDLVFCSMKYWGYRNEGLKNWSEYSGIDLCMFATGTITYLNALKDHICDFPSIKLPNLK